MPSYIIHERTRVTAADPIEAVEVQREQRNVAESPDSGTRHVEVEDADTGKRFEVDLLGGTYRTLSRATKPPADCVDVSQWPQLGPFKVKPGNVPGISIDGKDYRDGVYPIWSVGRVERDFTFEHAGVEFVARAGTVLLSRGGDFYQAPGIECLWLR